MHKIIKNVPTSEFPREENDSTNIKKYRTQKKKEKEKGIV